MTWAGRGPLLVMLSGGIDSAYCMWQALEHGRAVRAHHVRLASEQRRHRVEQHAVEGILDWLRGRGLDRFAYTESAFDWGGIERLLDVYVWAPVAGAILRHEPAIRQMAIPRHRDAFATLGTARRQTQVREDMVLIAARRHPEWVYPLEGLRKADIVAATPPELLDACWWCRTPRRGRPCHECLTCRQVDRVLAGGSDG